MSKETEDRKPLSLWSSVLANFLGGFLALLAIMVLKLLLTGKVM